MKIDFIELNKDEQALILISYFDKLRLSLKEPNNIITGKLIQEQLERVHVMVESEGYGCPREIYYNEDSRPVKFGDGRPLKIGKMNPGDISQFWNKFRGNWDELEGFDPIGLSGFGDPVGAALHEVANDMKKKSSENKEKAIEQKKLAVTVKFAESAMQGLLSSPGYTEGLTNIGATLSAQNTIESTVALSLRYGKELMKQSGLMELITESKGPLDL